MFDNILKFFRRSKKSENTNVNSKETAKERLHLVLMQDRANVSADFLDLMRQEIIEVIKKYIDIDESAMDVRLTNQSNEDGTQGAPALYANIPIVNIKDEARKANKSNQLEEEKKTLNKIEEITDEAKKEEEVKKVEEAKKIVKEECEEIEKEEKVEQNHKEEKEEKEEKEKNGEEKYETDKENNVKKHNKDEASNDEKCHQEENKKNVEIQQNIKK